jgi:hypothetical protein
MAHYGSEHNLSVALADARRDGRTNDAAQMAWALDEIKHLRSIVLTYEKRQTTDRRFQR